jgi:hypothetical protein
VIGSREGRLYCESFRPVELPENAGTKTRWRSIASGFLLLYVAQAFLVEFSSNIAMPVAVSAGDRGDDRRGDSDDLNISTQPAWPKLFFGAI